MLDAIAAATAIVSITPERVRSLVARVPADILARPPKAGEWSALECIEHLADVESLLARRFRAYLDGAEELPGMEPGPKGRTPAALVEAFARVREQNLQLVGTLTDADLERPARHPRYGMVTLGTHIQEWAGARPQPPCAGRAGDPPAIHRRLGRDAARLRGPRRQPALTCSPKKARIRANASSAAAASWAPRSSLQKECRAPS